MYSSRGVHHTEEDGVSWEDGEVWVEFLPDLVFQMMLEEGSAYV